MGLSGEPTGLVVVLFVISVSADAWGEKPMGDWDERRVTGILISSDVLIEQVKRGCRGLGARGARAAEIEPG